MNSSTFNIAIEVDDKGSVKLRELGKTANDAGVKGEKSFKGMRGQINKLKGDTDLSVSSFVKLGAVGFTATLAGITALSAAAVSWITTSGTQAHEMENLSRLAVMNSEDFQKAAFATQQYGVDQDKLADISKDTLEKLGEFTATGGGGFADFFEQVAPKIGLTAKELQGLSGPDVLVAVTDAMEKANLSYEEQSFYLESIASDTTMLIPLLKDHGAALKEQTDRADALGLAISNVETQRLVEAQKATNELTTAMGSLKTHIAAGLAPAFTDVTSKIMDGMTEGAGGVDNLAVTISEKLLGALGFAVETMRFFHNGWLGIKMVGTVAIDAIAQSLEFLFGGVRTLLYTWDKAFDGIVWAAKKMGKELTNPFDAIEQGLGTFAASSRDVTNNVLSDIDKTNAGYDSVKNSIDGYIGSIKESGTEAAVAAEKQINAANSIAAATKSSEENIQSYKGTTFVSTMSGYSSFQTASQETRDQLVADQTIITDDHGAKTNIRKANDSAYKAFATDASNAVVDVFAAGEDIKVTVGKLAVDTLMGFANQWASSSIDAILTRQGQEIGANVALGTAQTGTEGKTWQQKIATGAGYLAASAAAVFAGKAVGDNIFAEGGWLQSNPAGGMIRGGSGVADDIFLGFTDGGMTRNWGMGGEFVMNQEATAKYYPYLEAMNNKGLAEGGPVGDAMATTQDINASIFDTFWSEVIKTKGNFYAAAAQAALYGGGTIAGMLGGKAVGGDVFKAEGGLIANRYFGFGGWFTDPIGEMTGGDISTGDPLGDLLDPIVGDTISDLLFPDPSEIGFEALYEQLRKLPEYKFIADSLDASLYPFVRDVITPGVYPSGQTVEDSISGTLDSLAGSLEDYAVGGGILGSFEVGTDYVKETGPYMLHKGESVNTAEETKAKSGSLSEVNTTLKTIEKLIEQLGNMLEGDGAATVYNTGQAAAILGKWDRFGMPETEGAA